MLDDQIQVFDCRINNYILQVANSVISIGVISLLFAMIFKVLPDAHIAWKDVWLGAAVTAILFNVGKFLIAFYLGKSHMESAFGGAGSVAILLVWIYYSSQIFFFGAEFTQIYANRYGSKIEPEQYARRITEPERAEQGLGPIEDEKRPS
jgi:membrane protein